MDCSFAVQSDEMEMIMIEDENDLADPLERFDCEEDVKNTNLQLNDDICDEDKFYINEIENKYVYAANNHKQEQTTKQSVLKNINRSTASKIKEMNTGITKGNLNVNAINVINDENAVNVEVLLELKIERADKMVPVERNENKKKENLVKEMRSEAKAPRNHTEDKTIEIKQLKTEIDTAASMQQFKCKICNANFSKSPKYTEHIRTEHSIDKAFECYICFKAYRIQSLLAEHIRIHKGEKPYQCEECGRSFGQLQPYKAHVRMHKGERPYKCNHCPEAFFDTKKFKSHLRLHTNEQPFKCEICSRKFNHCGTFRAHMRTHTGEKPYQCTICGKLSSQIATHKTHMRTHSDEFRFSCTVCEKKFKQSTNLKSHMRVHTGELPYKCDVCDRRFAHSKSSRTHLRLHNGEKPYECSFCQKKFRHSNSHKHHLRTHTGEKLYQCSICLKPLAKASSLITHMRKHETKKQASLADLSVK